MKKILNRVRNKVFEFFRGLEFPSYRESWRHYWSFMTSFLLSYDVITKIWTQVFLCLYTFSSYLIILTVGIVYLDVEKQIYFRRTNLSEVEKSRNLRHLLSWIQGLVRIWGKNIFRKHSNKGTKKVNLKYSDYLII